MCIFKEFKDILGQPGKGIHKIRIVNTPLVDYAASILLAILITYINNKIPLVVSTILVLILGEILHVLFGVKTPTTNFLGIP